MLATLQWRKEWKNKLNDKPISTRELSSTKTDEVNIGYLEYYIKAVIMIKKNLKTDYWKWWLMMSRQITQHHNDLQSK